MRKVLFFSFFILSVRSYAQDILPLTFGPLASMSSTTLKSSPDFIDQVSGSGYDLGAMVRLKILLFYAQGEFTYSTKSSSVTIDTDTSSVIFKLKGPDVNLILGLKLLGLGDIGNLRIFGGYGWSNYTDIVYSINGVEAPAANIVSNNHSYILGAGVDLLRFSLDFKYNKGLVDLTDSGSSEVSTEVYKLSLYFRFK
jgi:hypothetical protein